jgi:hypothetical protein
VSAGLPGLGLGGLFFVLLALLAPFVELIRTTRGRSSVAAWWAVGRQFALALTMVAAVELTLRSLYALADATGLAEPLSDRSPTVLALRPIGITLGLLACVLAAAKAMQLIATIRTRGRPPVPALRTLSCRRRLLGQLGALTAVCFTLLLVGPSELAHAPEEDSAPRQAGSGSSHRAAMGGGDGEGPAPPPRGHRGTRHGRAAGVSSADRRGSASPRECGRPRRVEPGC